MYALVGGASIGPCVYGQTRSRAPLVRGYWTLIRLAAPNELVPHPDTRALRSWDWTELSDSAPGCPRVSDSYSRRCLLGRPGRRGLALGGPKGSSRVPGDAPASALIVRADRTLIPGAGVDGPVPLRIRGPGWARAQARAPSIRVEGSTA